MNKFDLDAGVRVCDTCRKEQPAAAAVGARCNHCAGTVVYSDCPVTLVRRELMSKQVCALR